MARNYDEMEPLTKKVMRKASTKLERWYKMSYDDKRGFEDKDWYDKKR